MARREQQFTVLVINPSGPPEDRHRWSYEVVAKSHGHAVDKVLGAVGWLPVRHGEVFYVKVKASPGFKLYQRTTQWTR